VVPGRAASRDAGRGGCCVCAWTETAAGDSNDRDKAKIFNTRGGNNDAMTPEGFSRSILYGQRLS
jgi:hypothetical protein